MQGCNEVALRRVPGPLASRIFIGFALVRDYRNSVARNSSIYFELLLASFLLAQGCNEVALRRVPGPLTSRRL